MTDEITENRIIELYMNNKTYKDISEILNIGKENIHKIIQKNKLSKKRKEKNIQIIKEGLKNKYSRDQIAATLGVTPSKVSNLAGAYKIPTSFRQFSVQNKESIILKLYEKKHLSIGKMAVETGFQYSFCKRVYKKYDLENKIIFTKKYKKLSKEETLQIIKEIKKGEKNLSEIGREHKVSRQWVAHLKKFNT